MLHELFRSAAVNHRSKPAVIDSAGAITYDNLSQAAQAFGARLASMGARAGDRVVLRLPNSIDAAVALWGALEAGCVMVTLHAGLSGDALRLRSDDADPHWLVERPGEIIARAVSSTESSIDLAALIYTSGSTGEPRGVMLSHANMR